MNFDASVLQIPIEDIIPNRFQPRLVFDDKALQELSDSIKQHGIIQPLVLRRVGDKFEIIAGERRYKAATMAGLTSVPAVISQADDRTSAQAAVVENIQRKDLNAIEEAKSYKALLDEGYMSQDQLAKKMGLSQSAISNKLRLLSLPEEIQNILMEGKISERHARSLLAVKDEKRQIELMNKTIDERLTVRELDKIIKADNDDENIDIKLIKEEAQDIVPIKYDTPVVTNNNDTFTMGAIELGEKTQNRFFNNLENEAANMKMTEAINPFSNFLDKTSPFETTTSVDTHINEASEIEENGEISFSTHDDKVLGEMSIVLNDNNSDKITTQEDEITSDDLPKIATPPKRDIIDFNTLTFDDISYNPNENKNLEDNVSLFLNPHEEVKKNSQIEVDNLDSLDFEPPKETKDINKAVDKINNIINEIRADNYNIESMSTDLVDQVTFTITIKKED